MRMCWPPPWPGGACGESVTAIVRHLKIGRSTLYRALQPHEESPAAATAEPARYVVRYLGEQSVESVGLVVKDFQGMISLDPDAQHGHGEQALGSEPVGDRWLIPAAANALKMRPGVAGAAPCISGKVSPHRAGREVRAAKCGRNADAHDRSLNTRAP